MERMSPEISGMKSVVDVAANANGQLTITDPVAYKVLIFKLVEGKFEVVNKFGSGLPGNEDGISWDS